MSENSNPADYALFDETFLSDMHNNTKNHPVASHAGFGTNNGHSSPGGQYPASNFSLIIPQGNYSGFSTNQDMYGNYTNVASQQQQQQQQQQHHHHQGGSMLRNQYSRYSNPGYDHHIKVESEDDVPGLSPNPKRSRFPSSARQSVSSVDTYRSPATPAQAPDTADDVVLGTATNPQSTSAAREATLLSIDKWLDDYLQNPTDLQSALPKLGRTFSDAVQDELYTPELISNNEYQNSNSANVASHYPNVYPSQQQEQQHQQLQAQQNSGSTSPYPVNSSQFVSLSSYNPSMDHQQYTGKNHTNVGNAAATAPRTTISPREALLEYSEPEGDVSHMNLFGPMPSESSRTSSRAESEFEELRSQSSRRESIATSSSSHGDSLRYGNITDQMSNSYSGAQYPSYSHQPAAPRHYSMDSGVERPSDTRANTGAYTCTFSGCGQRFTTSGKLQKHRREAHRKTTPTANSVSTAAAIASRNAQPGPHRCMRPNPSTGKPCNTVFSRPYDLTRHEDTIHNSHKQKVRCEICTDEKTFSRPDALVRHRRVKHGIH